MAEETVHEEEALDSRVQRLKEERAGLMNIIEGLLPGAEAWADHHTGISRDDLDRLRRVISSAHEVLR